MTKKAWIKRATRWSTTREMICLVVESETKIRVALEDWRCPFCCRSTRGESQRPVPGKPSHDYVGGCSSLGRAAKITDAAFLAEQTGCPSSSHPASPSLRLR